MKSIKSFQDILFPYQNDVPAKWWWQAIIVKVLLQGICWQEECIDENS